MKTIQYNITGSNNNIHFSIICFTEKEKDAIVENIKANGNQVVSVNEVEPDELISYYSDAYNSMYTDGLIKLGSIPNFTGSPTVYYCAPENEKKARVTFEKMSNSKKKHLDSHYSQPWV